MWQPSDSAMLHTHSIMTSAKTIGPLRDVPTGIHVRDIKGRLSDGCSRGVASWRLSYKAMFKRVDPTKFTRCEALKVAHCALESFANDASFQYIVGHKYGEILKTLDKNCPLYKTYAKGWARAFQIMVWSGSYDLYLLHDEDKNVIGLALWKYPDYMDQELHREFRLNRFSWRLRSRPKSLWAELINFIRFGFDQPLKNARMIRYQTDAQCMYSNVDRRLLPLLSWEQMTSTQYPHTSCVGLQLMAISPKHRGKGLGRKLLQQSMSCIPNVPVKFGSARGPQKLDLLATPMGFPLYQKIGFEPISQMITDYDGYQEIKADYMVYVRPSKDDDV
uniref:ARAD1D42746p n=1 Tax=Blastobotrys adeninivorans TaxID=409370 RepID=A0A060TIZ9_BLAAD